MKNERNGEHGKRERGGERRSKVDGNYELHIFRE